MPEAIVEQLHRNGQRVNHEHVEHPRVESVTHHGPGVQHRREPGSHHQQHVHNVLRISEEHVSHTENQTQTIGQQHHDEHARQNRPESQRGRMPTHRKTRQEHDHNLRHKMHQSHPHRRQREQLTRQVNLANQSAVNHHGASTIAEPLREEVNGNHARE